MTSQIDFEWPGNGDFPAPRSDATPFFDFVRAHHATEFIAAAVAHFDLFSKLADKPLSREELAALLGLAPRPAAVFFTALRAMGLLAADEQGRLDLPPAVREHLVPGGDFFMGDYVGLVAQNPGVKGLVERLRTNKPAEARPDEGAAFMYRDGMESAMDEEASARRLTLALAGRARIVAPILAQRFPLPDARVLLDVGGGTGLYSIGLLKRNPNLRAIIWDRAQVLKVAQEMGERFGVLDRMHLLAGDMFADPIPAGCDTILLSNILHDWDVPECQRLLDRCTAALSSGGQVLIHDVFLNDAMDGPLTVALYSTALFTITEGRAYSAAEYRAMLSKAGLEAGQIVTTSIHCGVLPAKK
ncbi:MAG TPA: methyltransferase [Humisphaera sp.]|jgi:precorrin-6B methylase 2|nr:methyltransferase [Humisphaera sp.]